MTRILLLSDIHGNFPALLAVADFFAETHFDEICNCGDSLVYAPFPNETLSWLQSNRVHSIIGNTDLKVKKLLKGKTFNKPKKFEKRIMYDWTAEQLTASSRKYLLSLKKSKKCLFADRSVCLFHGSPAHPNEFLFPDTPKERFAELARDYPCDIILCGHSHTPFYLQVGDTHFINPGSIGRMFDSNPAASCAVLTLDGQSVNVEFYRIQWPIQQTIQALKSHSLPEIYQSMYKLGKKLN